MHAWKPSITTRATITVPVIAELLAKKVEADEAVLNRLLAMEEKLNKMVQKDF